MLLQMSSSEELTCSSGLKNLGFVLYVVPLLALLYSRVFCFSWLVVFQARSKSPHQTGVQVKTRKQAQKDDRGVRLIDYRPTPLEIHATGDVEQAEHMSGAMVLSYVENDLTCWKFLICTPQLWKSTVIRNMPSPFAIRRYCIQIFRTC